MKKCFQKINHHTLDNRYVTDLYSWVVDGADGMISLDETAITLWAQTQIWGMTCV